MESYSIAQDDSTTLGRLMGPEAKAHAGQSGFAMLWDGKQSLEARLGLIQAAEKTLDLQYYIIANDATSGLLLEALLRAAERGVRVRLIIDNISLGEIRKSLAVLDGVRNIEVRVFNPPAAKGPPVFNLLFALNRATKRMHNKALIADNQLAITGGRNLGDEYFDADPESSFYDLDVLTAGPVTARLSKSFDDYWNSEFCVPLAVKHGGDRGKLRAGWEETLQKPGGHELLETALPARFGKGDIQLHWAEGDIASDEPEKIEQAFEVKESKTLNHLARLTSRAHSEFLLISPYFVPQAAGVEWLTGLVKRGIRVRVLTNSLASTDVVAAHTGYARYRRALVEGGVELYETKPVGPRKPRQRLAGSEAPAHASMHAKVYVVDRKDIVAGSFNLDPRSISLNTEVSLIIRSAEMANDIAARFDTLVAPQNAYKIEVEDGKIVWVTEENGHTRRYTGEPRAGGRKFQSFLMSLLPFEGQL